jgi:NAD(P)-dependent dehydrogenase (short-subunit alcohol dehydrogenase family)
MTDEYPDGYLEQTIATHVPAGRTGRPEEFVAAVVFLASDAASYVTGITMPVDGGTLT